MASMTHEYSNFPESYITLHNYQDVTDQIGALINQIKTLQASGNYVQAQRVIEQNKNVLAQYVITTDAINAIEEETRNVEIYAKQKKQQVYYQDDEPDTETVGDIWIG